MGAFSGQLLPLILLFSWGAAAQPPSLSTVVSTFSLPETWLRPYDWTYLRVVLPSWFSSMTMTFTSDVDIDEDRTKKLLNSLFPLMCFKSGSPPLPDFSDDYLKDLLSNSPFNGTFIGMENVYTMEQCIPFQENLTVTLTSEQISPGIWYLGFFNGLGPARTQSKMISRGKGHMFTASIRIEGCTTSSLGGPHCNQTIDTVSCSQSSNYMHSRIRLNLKEYTRSNLNHPLRSGGHWGNNYYLPSEYNHVKEKEAVSNPTTLATVENLITCNNSFESSCFSYGELKFYSLDIVGIASHYKISVAGFRINQTASVDILADLSDISLMCYVRYNAMPLGSAYDYSADIRKEPLTVRSPRSGRWYIAVQALNQTRVNKVVQEMSAEANMCFSFDWELHECLNGKAGMTCMWEMYMLQRVPKTSSGIPFESYYVPMAETGSIKPDFPLEYLLSNSSVNNSSWTYFFIDVPSGAAGANMHFQLISDSEVEYEVYLKHEGLAYVDSWDFYLNSSGSSNGSMFLALVDPDQYRTDIYILYAREGTWCFGLKHPSDSLHKDQATMSVSLEGCSRHCSYNGDCHYSVDRSGMTFYSYCSCDRDHGGFDCSNELVSPVGHIWQSVFLIASNAAAMLPAFWALRQKAFAEWVLFTSSGISSGLYHACDVGTWCPLSFHVLQFMDFWLSFMAVVSTFIYMTTIDEASKRAIHTSVAILTALLAVSGATRSANIILVIAIGSLGLLIGWLLEFYTANRSSYCPALFELLANERWESIKLWLLNLFKALHKRFRWIFLLLGFITLALAGISWKLESNESYWIWHRQDEERKAGDSVLLGPRRRRTRQLEDPQPRGRSN